MNQKELIEALEYIEQIAKWHYDENAKEDDPSPDDMVAFGEEYYENATFIDWTMEDKYTHVA